jgi:hypothetical protein
MKRNKFYYFVLLISGCASSPGVIPIGPDTYMVSEQGWISTQSTGELKSKAYQKAGAYCVKQGMKLMPVSTNQVPGVIGRSYPEVELQFMCLTEKDYELRRPKLQPLPNVRIEDGRQ